MAWVNLLTRVWVSQRTEDEVAFLGGPCSSDSKPLPPAVAQSINVVTNGHGKRVERVLGALASDVEIENSRKGGSEVVEGFESFTLAPLDLPEYDRVDYRNGCRIVETCGMGLTPWGYYPCAVAGAIDRVHGFDLGRRELPRDGDDMRDLLDRFCRHCGHFKHDRLDEHRTSTSWAEAYERYRRQRPSLTKF